MTATRKGRSGLALALQPAYVYEQNCYTQPLSKRALLGQALLIPVSSAARSRNGAVPASFQEEAARQKILQLRDRGEFETHFV